MQHRSTPDTLSAGWSDLKRRRLFYWLSWLALIPAVIVGGFFQQHWHSSWPMLLALLAVIILHMNVRQKLTGFRCPRCGQPFFWLFPASPGRYFPPLGMPVFLQSQCANCGLAKFASGSTNEEHK
jgi:hypothetical protein